MEKAELAKLLKEINIPTLAYNLEGGLPIESYVINKNGDKWETYYSERGKKVSLSTFFTESDACNYFYIWMKKISLTN